MEPTQKVDLNNASMKHLTGLPGIPVNIARRIVAYRKRHGGIIHEWDELLNVNGFPGDRLDEIKARAVLGLPSARKAAVEGPLLHHFPGQKASRKAGKGHP
ncbi:MAG: helix-hairpin-helix domain-containing protein [Acidobacteriia bacterium]|nr:helix-hairpin-helix domain-containing protein [Terriglobia bacterium]